MSHLSCTCEASACSNPALELHNPTCPLYRPLGLLGKCPRCGDLLMPYHADGTARPVRVCRNVACWYCEDEP